MSNFFFLKFLPVLGIVLTVAYGLGPEGAMEQLKILRLQAESLVEEVRNRGVEEERRLAEANAMQAQRNRELERIRAEHQMEIERIRAEQRQAEMEHAAQQAERERAAQGRKTAGQFLRGVVGTAVDYCRREDC